MFPNRGALTTFRLTYLLVPLLLFLFALPVLAISDNEALSAMEASQAGFRIIHAKVAPAIVSITSQMQEENTNSNPFDYFFGSPSTPSTPRMVRASGSGVIIRREGIVLTNSHVVANATKVTVQLSGSDKKLPAEVVQADPRTDLAIVRILEKGDYPVATLGDAKTVKVGDWAIAFGNPFNLATTMTVGVISATGRQLYAPDDQNRFRDLLQTDASINPGNSGGALVNDRGEVIGINFMIYSPGSSAGSVGIGFAIPVNDYTKQIIETLVAGHSFERGRLGIVVKSLDDTMKEQYGVNAGVLVDSVLKGQAADKANMQAEDVITEYDGTKITDADQFVNLVERTKPGTKVTLRVIRDRKEQTITVTVGSIQPENSKRASVDEQKVGFAVQTLTPDIAARMRLEITTGVLVSKVQPGSPAEDAGFQPGDVIQRVGFDDVTTAEDFWTTLSKQMASAKHGVMLRVRRGDMATTLTLPLTGDLKKND